MPANRNTSETVVVATRCEFAYSFRGAVVDGRLTSATFNNCLFHSNRTTGIDAHESTIHLHGKATAIHSNGVGVFAQASGKVLVHLSSHHSTIYNNSSRDRSTVSGGTITNIED